MNPNPLFNRIFILGLIFTLIPFFLIGLFNHPAAFDDFQGAVLLLEKGPLGFFNHFYYGWSGRYTASIILAYLNPLIYESWLVGFKVFPTLLLLMMLSSGAYFFKSLWAGNQKADWFTAIGLSALFLAVYLFSIPAVAEMFYWITGASAYLSAMILFFILGGSVVNFNKTSSGFNKVIFGTVASVSMLAIMGTNEAVIMAMLFLSFIALLYNLFTKPGNAFFLIFLFVVACIAAFLSIKAPGNAARASLLLGEESMFSIAVMVKAAIKAVIFTSQMVMGWLTNFALILFFILFIPLGLKLLNQNSRLAHLTNIHPAASIFLSFVFISIQTFPSFVGTGDVEPRVWSGIYFFFLIAFLYNVLVIINYFKPALERSDFKFLGALKLIFIILLIFSGEGNISKAYMDLFLRAPAYDASLKERYALADKAKGKDVVVPPIFERNYKYPKTIFFIEITPDPKDGTNRGMANYFNLKSIRLEKASQN